MSLHRCTVCDAALEREQHSCTHCGALLGYVPELAMLCAFEDRGEAGWFALGAPGVGLRLPCSNYGEHPICNWTVAADASTCLCESCRSTLGTPHLSGRTEQRRWARIERAKRRLFVGLRELGVLDVDGRIPGQSQVLFDVRAGAAADSARAVRADPGGPILIDPDRVDEESDGSLFAALREAIGLRLCLDADDGACRALLHARLFGPRVGDVDRALAHWQHVWASHEAMRAGAGVALRQSRDATGGESLPAESASCRDTC